MLRGHVRVHFSIEPHSPVHADFAVVGSEQAGDAIQQSGLPCSGGSEENGDTGRAFASQVEGESMAVAGERFADPDGKGSRTPGMWGVIVQGIMPALSPTET